MKFLNTTNFAWVDERNTVDFQWNFDTAYTPSPITLTVVNPGAETGDATGWTNSVGSLGVKSSSPAPYAGSYYFYGGTNAETKAYQDVDLLTAGLSSSAIDAGDFHLLVEWYQSSYEVSDQAQVYVEYYTSGMSLISSASIGLGAVDPALTWGYRYMRSQVPATARYVRMYLHMYRISGTSNDGNIDNVSAKAFRNIYHLGITNRDADTGDTTGWTNELGGVAAKSSANYTAGYCFSGGNYAETKSYQDLDLISQGISADIINGEYCYINIEWHQSGYSGDDDSAEVIVYFLNSSSEIIGYYYPGLIEYDSAWHYRVYNIPIPGQTRYVRVKMHMLRTGGTENSGYVDEIHATVIQRFTALNASITASSSTSSASPLTIIDLLASVNLSSLTSSASPLTIVNLLASVNATSLTSTATAVLPNELQASITATSLTSSATPSISVLLTAAINPTSLTSSITAQAIIDLLATISASSLTSSAASILQTPLQATISASSQTSSVTPSTEVILSGAISASSLTSSIAAQLTVLLSANIQSTSETSLVTPDTLVQLLADVQLASTTGTATPSTMVVLLADIQAQSDTSQATPETTCLLAASIPASSSTSVVDPISLVELSSAIQGASLTSTVDPISIASLVASILAVSETSSISGTSTYYLTSNIQLQSNTGAVNAFLISIFTDEPAFIREKITKEIKRAVIEQGIEHECISPEVKRATVDKEVILEGKDLVIEDKQTIIIKR